MIHAAPPELQRRDDTDKVASGSQEQRFLGEEVNSLIKVIESMRQDKPGWSVKNQELEPGLTLKLMTLREDANSSSYYYMSISLFTDGARKANPFLEFTMDNGQVKAELQGVEINDPAHTKNLVDLAVVFMDMFH